MLETPGSSCVRRQHVAELLGEYLLAAEHRVTGKPPCADEKSDTPSRQKGGPRLGGNIGFEPFAIFVRMPDMTQ